MAIQEKLGADVAMCLDHCPRLACHERGNRGGREPNDRLGRRAARRRTAAPIKPFSESFRAARMPISARVVPKRLSPRISTAMRSAASAWAKGPAWSGRRSQVTTHLLPDDRPRYLMGVGRPQDILDAVATGVDLFDCVMPTRNGRNATCFSDKGYVRLRNASHRGDSSPIEESCACLACRSFSRSYLRHLFLAKEMLGPILATIHNLTFLHRLTSRIREAIAEGRFVQLRLEVLEALGP